MSYDHAVMAVWMVALLATFVGLVGLLRTLARTDAAVVAVVEATDPGPLRAAAEELEHHSAVTALDRTSLLDR